MTTGIVARVMSIAALLISLASLSATSAMFIDLCDHVRHADLRAECQTGRPYRFAKILAVPASLLMSKEGK
jgi:hypothetical protein